MTCVNHPECGCPDDLDCIETPRRGCWPVILWAIVGWAVIAGIAWYFLTSTASAHDSRLHMQYDGVCCNGNREHGDCQEIPEASVKAIPGGFQITLAPGDHRKVTKVHVFQIEQSLVKDSTDGMYHACLYPNEDTLRCFYAPPMGF